MTDVPPWGRFKPETTSRLAIAASRRLDGTLLSNAAASVARRIVGLNARPGEPIDVETWGLRTRLDPRRNIADRRLLFAPERFGPVERAMLAAHLRPGDQTVDIGANIGGFTLWMARIVGPQGRVLAIEPQESVLRRLRANAALNPHLPIIVAGVAAGARVRRLPLVLDPRNEGESSLSVTDRTGREVVEVEVRPLMDLVVEAGLDRIDALKIDVEGHEAEVLLPFFANAPREMWPLLLVMERGEGRQLAASLESAGYRLRVATKGNDVYELAPASR